MTEAVCRQDSDFAPFRRIEKLSFAEIPHQNRLFLDFLNNPQAVERFYPSTFRSHAELESRVLEVLKHYETDRNLLADALLKSNKKWNASAATLENIERLREKNSVAVVTGQQAGLFTGALYTIYKAISTIKVATCLRSRGVNSVPVFWIASEDHDFAEVAETFIQNREWNLSELRFSTTPENEGLPVDKIALNDSVNKAIETLFNELPQTEFSESLKETIARSYLPNQSLSDCFGRLMTRLFGEYGLILFDPLEEKLKKLAAPIYKKAVEKSAEITEALMARGKELETAGYHAQILIEADSFPLFWIDENGKRQALKVQSPKSKVQSRSGKKIEIADLIKIAAENPARLSPNVTLRGAAQDFLLPTLCYFGGAAEIAYWAQTAEVYRILERPQTPIFHRASVTVVDAKTRRSLENYNLKVTDFFTEPENLFSQIVERFLASETARIFAEAEEIINTQLNRLNKSLIEIEPTLSENLAQRRRKILYHIGALRKKFHRAEILRNEIAHKRIENGFAALYPREDLQERTLNVNSFLARYGGNFIGWLVNAVDADSREHQIFYL